MDKYNVRFHFPHSFIALEKQGLWQVEDYRTAIEDALPFTVTDGRTKYTINLGLMTYMEVRPEGI